MKFVETVKERERSFILKLERSFLRNKDFGHLAGGNESVHAYPPEDISHRYLPFRTSNPSKNAKIRKRFVDCIFAGKSMSTYSFH